jgi:N-acetylglucosaminyldiphosphoundecaprenol N-acetyl-beta-D-mannosaminyltransferase
MSLIKQNILGVKVVSEDENKILEYIEKYLFSAKSGLSDTAKKPVKPLVITTPNPEQIVLATQDSWFAELLNKSDVTLPDGIGVVIAGRFLPTMGKRNQGGRIRHRVSGVDFMVKLTAIAADRRVRIGLIGGFDDLAVNALECLKEDHPKLSGWAVDGPELTYKKKGMFEAPDSSYWAEIADRIITTKTALVFVGLGAPKQEYAIEKVVEALAIKRYSAPLVCMAVGGSFAMITDRLKRAPLVIRSIGFEWFWRLIQEPWRWQRQRALITYIVLVLQKILQTLR